MTKLVCVCFSILIALGTVRAKLDCLPLDQVGPGQTTLKERYDIGGKPISFGDLQFPVKVFEFDQKLKSYSIYKYSLKVMQNPFTERSFNDGSVDFGVLECRLGADGVYIKRQHLKAVEWCPTLDKITDRTPDSSEFVEFSDDGTAVGFSYFRKGDREAGPYNQISQNWDKLIQVSEKDGFEFRKTDISKFMSSEFGSNDAAPRFDDLYFRAKIAEVPALKINLMNAAFGFDQIEFMCIIDDGYYYGKLSQEYKSKSLAEWKVFLKNAKKERLDMYVNLAGVVKRWADFGYVNNNLSYDKWLSKSDSSFGFTDFTCAQDVNSSDEGCGRPINRFFLRTQSGAMADLRSDVYSFALNIVNIEAGKTTKMFETNAKNEKVNLDSIQTQDNAKEPTQHFIKIVKNTLTTTWGAADDSITIRNGQFGKLVGEVFTPATDVTLTSAILAIVREYAGDMSIGQFRNFLEALKTRTNNRIVL